MPIVSAKYFIARMWFVIPVFFLGIKIFKDYHKTKIFIWLYAVALFIVVIYTVLRLSAASSFAKNAVHFAVKPFYKDHTAFGAITAFFTPVFWLFCFNKKYTPVKRLLSLIFAVFFTTALFLSYSRAAWLGFAVSIVVFIFVKLRIKFKYILLVSVLIFAFVYTFWFQILDRLEKNRQDSSSNLSEQIMSITNVSTDASNLERLNRWYCAIEMFKEKPLIGWGPGTYQFQYAPFQLNRMKTIISTDFGDVGNSHSEYLGPLAEEGILGFISVIFMFLSIFITGLKLYRKNSDPEVRILILGITMSFVTYFVHGIMNDFLDTDKLAVPFFGFAAILVAIDLYHSQSSDAIF
jgi:O-antigen ligase